MAIPIRSATAPISRVCSDERTMSDLNRINNAKVYAAEEAAIAGIPAWLAKRMDEAQATHEAKGGCPGCGCMVLACHTSSCELPGDFY